MAPEQHRRETVDERADQFSFCVALWEALHGERPFRSTTLAELAAAVVAGTLEEPPRTAGIPPWVRRVLERGLASDPDRRYASMDDLLAELLGDVALAEGRIADAKQFFERAIEASSGVDAPDDPRPARARFGMARTILAAGDRAGGIALAREAREAHARDPGARHYLARVDDWLAEHEEPR